MIEGIVFDMDGTLIDTASVLAKAWEQAFISEGVGVEYEDLYKNTRGVSSRDIIHRYGQSLSDEDAIKIKEKRRNNFLHLVETDKTLLYPETLNVIRKLKDKGIRTAIGTGMSRDLLENVLKMTGLNDLIDIVVSSDDVKEGKPAPDVFIEAFNRLGIDPHKGMVVGDSVNDILPGKKIGSFTVFISRSGEKLDIADESISNLGELLNFV
jgi:HAD superfamily hydrolase (TIGR01509 family)